MTSAADAPPEAFAARRDAQWPIASAALRELYGATPGFVSWLAEVEVQVRDAAAARPTALRRLDAEREARPDWFQAPDRIAYTTYVDRFAGTLQGVEAKIPWLRALGVTYLHPLPLSRPRVGESDGGFAVADYLDVDPRLGTRADLAALCDALRAQGISLVLDVVCNHTADDHAWAQAARAGDVAKREFYHVLARAADARAWEATLVDVFPETAPGSFTEVAGLGWVWTTFYPFQWDLNYANPAVFAAMLAVLLDLANLGAEGFRLDSAPFLWKAFGTTCRNRPQAHRIVQAWRALLSIAAPGVLLKAEAIENLDDVLPFFGPHAGPAECQLAYNNGAMTALWAALATGDVAPVRAVIAAAAARPARGAWLNYVRCHDDLIWSALSPYASGATIDALSRFYAGEAPGPFAPRGEAFQAIAGAAPSTNGMTADLAAIDPAAGAQDPGVARALLLYAVVFALDGVPLIYMGDEIGQPGDPAWAERAERADDGRWLQRPAMDWARAARRDDPASVEGAMFSGLARFARLRAAEPALHAAAPARAQDLGDTAVLAFTRGEGADRVTCVANFSADARRVELGADRWRDLLTGDDGEGACALPPWRARWLKTPPRPRPEASAP